MGLAVRLLWSPAECDGYNRCLTVFHVVLASDVTGMPVPNIVETTRSKLPNGIHRRRGKRLIRVVLLLAFVSGVTSIGILGAMWWDERPLARIAAALETSDFQKALESADAYLARHPDDTRAGLFKARALSGLGRHREADALFERIARHFNGFPDDDEALRAWAFSLLHLKRWHAAIPKLKNLVESHPSDPDLVYSLTAAQIRARQFAQALENAERLGAIPGYADKAGVMIGTIHHDQGNSRLALAAWEKVLARNPQAADLQVAAGDFLNRVGDEMLVLGMPRRAVSVLERSVAIHAAADGFASLGKAYSEIGRSQDARVAWKRAVKLDHQQQGARVELANAALLEGRPRDALDWLLPLATTGRLKSSTAYLLQRVYTRLNQPEAAAHWKKHAARLRRTESVDSTLDRALNSSDPLQVGIVQAYQLAEQKRWKEAETLLKELLRQFPGNPMLSDLSTAVRKRGPLPDMTRLTGKQY